MKTNPAQPVRTGENKPKAWDLSSAGRASALQAGGHRFESYCAHHFFGPVVQLVRTLACHARGRRFEPDPGRHFFIILYIVGSIAQLVEQGTENPRVSGSIPLRATTKHSEGCANFFIKKYKKIKILFTFFYEKYIIKSKYEIKNKRRIL